MMHRGRRVRGRGYIRFEIGNLRAVTWEPPASGGGGRCGVPFGSALPLRVLWAKGESGG
jgi:hypothetical protein